MDSHAHMCDLGGKQQAGQHKGGAQGAQLEQGSGSLVSSKSLPSDDVRSAAWKYDQQQQQQHHHPHRAVYQEPPQDSSGSGAGKLTASLGRLLKTAGRLLAHDNTRTKRLLYSELAAASEASYGSHSAKAPEEGHQVRGQQFFSLGSSQDLLLAAGSQPTESEADTQTPCGSGQASHMLLEDESGHSSSAPAAAGARASPGSAWLQSMLQQGRNAGAGPGSSAGVGSKRPLSGSLLSSSSEDLAAAGGAFGAVNSGAASPSSSGWELTSTGAANPCGSLQSTLLDLFSDMVDDTEAVTW
jgi:hypothetical protein